MTTYVITVPGTFVHGMSDGARTDIERRLRPQDPKNTDLGENEELSLLTVEEDGRFAARVEVEAADRSSAEHEAVRLVSGALRDSGVAETDAMLGAAVVTGIDTGIDREL
ncbi:MULTISPECIES: hypothetical protein [unclassified Streptomyces]|uniref:hypothetical protein n=1 Tax=unclassified Streptomyces TaxID=2593676 RepID=UPI0011CD795C|nr:MULTISPECIES: hypothetical protein [unclassified Streptomyces]TXS65537.1 hypothetical protein EAO69_30785 [Streptomyces sp. me109]